MRYDEIKTYGDLEEYVSDNDNVATIEMLKLREIHKVQKLGSTVRENISKKLKQKGLDHCPGTLPSYYDEDVRIYKAGTPLSELIDAVNYVGEEYDKKLIRLANNDAQDILGKIKELLED